MLDRIVGAIGRFGYRRRYLVAVLALILLIGVTVLQSFAVISFSYSDYNKVTDVFPEDDTLVIIYDNVDEGKIAEIAAGLMKDPHVTSLRSYATTLGLQMNTAELAATAGIDEAFIKTLFYIKEHGTATNGMTFTAFINFVASDAFLNNQLFADKIDAATRAQLLQTKSLVNTVAAGTELDAASLAATFGMDAQQVSGIFGMMGGVQTMSIENFVNAMLGMAEQDPAAVAPEQLAGLQQMKGLVTLATSPQALTPEQLVAMFPVESDMLNADTVALLCLMYEAQLADMSGKTLALYDFFIFITTDVLQNPTFAPFFDEESKATMLGAKETMESGKAQLIGAAHSRMIVTLDHVPESDEMYDFYSALEAELDEKLEGDYYLVGSSAMSNELSKTFKGEYLMISIITAVAIFVVVCVTFKKVFVSALLVCIIECAVFVTMSVMTVASFSMYFLALLVVQCVLMGAMVDYGILFSNYYVEVRREYPVETALPEVLKRSVRAIATSALILISITFVCGWFMVGAVASILAALCLGSFAALMLVLFALPSLLAIFDKVIVKEKKE